MAKRASAPPPTLEDLAAQVAALQRSQKADREFMRECLAKIFKTGDGVDINDNRELMQWREKVGFPKGSTIAFLYAQAKNFADFSKAHKTKKHADGRPLTFEEALEEAQKETEERERKRKRAADDAAGAAASATKRANDEQAAASDHDGR